MMVIDTVQSSGVGRMHGRTGGMRIARPGMQLFHDEKHRGHNSSQQAPEAKLIVVPSPGMVAENKGTTPVELDSGRPGLVIRRRIMVRQSEEADGRYHGLMPALLNQPNPFTTTTVNHPHGNTDHSSKHRDIIAFSRSSSPRAITNPQDQFRKSQAPMTKPPKTLRLFDLNRLPIVQENIATSSPTSTVASADSSTTHVTTNHASTSATMATRSSFDTDVFFGSSSPSIERFRDARGGALAVDLGVLAPTRRDSIDEDSSRQGKPQSPREADCCYYSGSERDVPITPARKRLRRLSEYAGGHSSPTSMAKSWTTDGDGDGCNHRDVTKTLAAASPSQADAKVRRRRPDDGDDDDDEVSGAVAALLMLSSTNNKRPRRDFPFSSNGESSSSDLNGSTSTFAGEEHRRETTPAGSDHVAASDNESPSRSSGSGGSVLLRPRNKQRYRSMTEIMAQTPILRHGCSKTG